MNEEQVKKAHQRLEEVLAIPEEKASIPHEETIRMAISELEDSIDE